MYLFLKWEFNVKSKHPNLVGKIHFIFFSIHFFISQERYKIIVGLAMQFYGDLTQGISLSLLYMGSPTSINLHHNAIVLFYLYFLPFNKNCLIPSHNYFII